mmetsp:Transcript_64977/g.174275  ORF Transcript_64977/g.174275 Transcript_64977/m.174275 type:complete len:515 (-) Transcript_64977:103-1647(-)
MSSCELVPGGVASSVGSATSGWSLGSVLQRSGMIRLRSGGVRGRVASFSTVAGGQRVWPSPAPALVNKLHDVSVAARENLRRVKLGDPTNSQLQEAVEAVNLANNSYIQVVVNKNDTRAKYRKWLESHVSRVVEGWQGAAVADRLLVLQVSAAQSAWDAALGIARGVAHVPSQPVEVKFWAGLPQQFRSPDGSERTRRPLLIHLSPGSPVELPGDAKEVRVSSQTDPEKLATALSYDAATHGGLQVSAAGPAAAYAALRAGAAACRVLSETRGLRLRTQFGVRMIQPESDGGAVQVSLVLTMCAEQAVARKAAVRMKPRAAWSGSEHLKVAASTEHKKLCGAVAGRLRSPQAEPCCVLHAPIRAIGQICLKALICAQSVAVHADDNCGLEFEVTQSGDASAESHEDAMWFAVFQADRVDSSAAEILTVSNSTSALKLQSAVRDVLRRKPAVIVEAIGPQATFIALDAISVAGGNLESAEGVRLRVRPELGRSSSPGRDGEPATSYRFVVRLVAV